MVKLNYFSRVLNYLNAFKKVSLDLRGYKICENRNFFLYVFLIWKYIFKLIIDISKIWKLNYI